MSWIICAYLSLTLSSLVRGDDNAAHQGLSSRDPLNDFCRRWGHATASVDHNLYIDGGYVNWSPLSENPRNWTNRYLLYQDLNVTFEGVPRLYANLTKNRTETFVAGGALWVDPVDKYLYSFGGEGTSTKTPVVEGLETYDIIYNKWNRTKIPWHMHRVSWSASTTAIERGEGYQVGGWVNNRTTPGFQGEQMTAGLVKYDMCKNAFSNVTGPDANGRSEGSLVFIPAGDAGMLVYFGGLLDPSFNGSMIGSPMDIIFLYNIQNDQWYTQKATGDIPPMRRRFCAGVTWPKDYSSYNIYVFGGLGVPPNGAGFDDVYILTLPSFQWIKWWTSSSKTARPRHSMTCTVINKAQMIVIGGTFPGDDQCDSPTSWGTHNLHLNGNSPRNHAQWDRFYFNITTYEVPTAVLNKIGGSPSGGATIKAPSTWTDPDLSTLLSLVATFPSRKPTRPLSSNAHIMSTEQRNSIIIGCVIGGIVLFMAFVFFYFLRNKNRKGIQPKQSPRVFAQAVASNQSVPQFELSAHQVSEIAERATIKSPQELGDKEIYLNSRSSSSADTPPSPATRLVCCIAPSCTDGACATSDGSRQYVNAVQSAHQACRADLESPSILPQASTEKHCHLCGSPTGPVAISNSGQGMYEGIYTESTTRSYRQHLLDNLIPEPLNVRFGRERVAEGEGLEIEVNSLTRNHSLRNQGQLDMS